MAMKLFEVLDALLSDLVESGMKKQHEVPRKAL